jgi:SAM-dependent methyltransferase
VTQLKPAGVWAMDLDPLMIEKARRYLPAWGRQGISLYAGDAACLPHGDKTFDAVFGFGVLHHVPHWQEALAEIARVLKAGGVYCFEELYPSLYQNALTRYILLHPAENRFHSADLKRALYDAGLEPGGYLEHEKIGVIGIAAKRETGGGKPRWAYRFSIGNVKLAPNQPTTVSSGIAASSSAR